MSKKSLLCRKVLAALSCLAVLLAMVVISPVETKADGEPYILLDIVVLYNDAEAACYDYVVGDQLKITGPGTYTMTFDCATDLQAEQKNAGITGLNNLTAVYLTDDQVLNAVTIDSIVNAFDFTYDSVVIDGTEVELTNHDERSGLKSMGQIDTNGPVNSWEDCQLVDGTYSIENYVLNFIGFDNPQVIEITFTVTNIEFKESATEADTEEENSEEETTEEATEESTEEVTEAATEEVTETPEEAATEAESTAATASEESTNDGNNTLKIILIVVIVIILIAVIILVIKKLKK